MLTEADEGARALLTAAARAARYSADRPLPLDAVVAADDVELLSDLLAAGQRAHAPVALWARSVLYEGALWARGEQVAQ